MVSWPVTNVLAFTTTRSHLTDSVNQLANQSEFSHFNLGTHVGDNLNRVQHNRVTLAKILPSNCKIQWLDQVHGSHVVTINDQVNQPIQADAIITQSPKVALAIMTADCLPILLSNNDGTEIAAIHGGWRSLADNIISNTLAKMDSHCHQLHAWLGPCIGPDKFEIGEEVKSIFMQQSKLFAQAFVEQNVNIKNNSSNNKYLANLQLIAQIQLQQLGISNITSLSECTYSQKNKYFSFRRDKITGRMATVICRK